MSVKVTIIGAGIAGAAVAFSLARRGAEVLVIDADYRGQATAASAGIVSPWTSSSEGEYYTAYVAGGNYYPTLLELLAEANITLEGYRQGGSLVVGQDPAWLDVVEARVRPRVEEAGPVAGEVQRLDPKEARALFPALAPQYSALFVTGGRQVDGRALRDSLLEGARRYGAVQRTGRAELQAAKNHIEVLLDGEIQHGDVTVVASGAWSNQVLEAAGSRLPISPQRGEVTHLSLEGVDTSAWPALDPASGHYVVPFDNGRVVLGATRETGSGYDPRKTASGQLEVLRNGLSVAPGLADATLLEGRVGLRPLPDQQLPVAGPVPGYSDLWAVTGYGAIGLTIAPLFGDVLSKAILGQNPRGLNMLARP